MSINNGVIKFLKIPNDIYIKFSLLHSYLFEISMSEFVNLPVILHHIKNILPVSMADMICATVKSFFSTIEKSFQTACVTFCDYTFNDNCIFLEQTSHLISPVIHVTLKSIFRVNFAFLFQFCFECDNLFWNSSCHKRFILVFLSEFFCHMHWE